MQSQCTTPLLALERPPTLSMTRSEGFSILLIGADNVHVEVTLPKKQGLKVSDLKEAIFKRVGIEPRKQSLYFHKLGLADTRTLEESGIGEYDVVKVEGTLLGGCLPRDTCYCFEILCCCLLMEA